MLKHAGGLTLAAFSSPAGETVGTECVRGLTAVALGPERLSRLFGFVNLDEDADGVTRRTRLAFPDREGKLRPAWAARAARSLGSSGAPEAIWIDPAVDWRRLERISWQDLRGRLARDPALVRGRLVLLGGDFIASGDGHRISRRTAAAVSGVVLQALIVDALLSGRPVREAGALPCLLAAGLVCAAWLAAALCLPRSGLTACVAAGLSGLYVLAAFAVSRELRVLLPVTVPLLAVALSIGVGLAMQRGILFWTAAALSIFLYAAPLAAEPAAAVAVVASLSGSAAVAILPAEEKRSARLFDWLPAGAVIETGPNSSVVLAFAEGSRWELRENGKATLAAGGLQAVKGAARRLAPMPPMPRIAGIAPAARAGARSGAIRIRGERIRGLYPRGGCTALAGATVLRFAPREDASRYGVEVEDEADTVVFKVETASPAVEVPAGILRSGARYRWRVRTLDRVGPAVQGESEFQILMSEDGERRAALRAALEGEGEAGSLALLAAIDRRTGLLAEAREGFRAALAKSPTDAALCETLDEVENELAADREDTDSRSEPSFGVVVEEAAQGLAASEAGMRSGDLILSWSRESAPPARGEIASPFDLAEIEIEQAPRGRVTLAGRHGGEEMQWKLTPGEWGLAVRPNVQEAAGDAVERWRAAWSAARAAKALAAAQRWPEADEAYAAAVAEAGPSGEPKIAAQLLREWGETFRKRSDWSRAEDCYRRALAKEQEIAAESLAGAWSLGSLGNLALFRGDLATAETTYRQVLAIREKLAPESLEVSRTLLNLGTVSLSRGELTKAQELDRRALAIQEKLAPGGLDFAKGLNNLGLVARGLGDLAGAEEYHRRALAIREKLAPGSLDLAQSLNNLGHLASSRGDLATAQEHFRRALALKEKLLPGSLDVATTLTNLGTLARDRGDLAGADEYHRRSLAIREKLAPDSLDVAASLNNLGVVALDRGDFAAAWEYHRRALSIREKLAPASPDVATSLNNMGIVARNRGDLKTADEFYRRALAIQEGRTPRSLEVAVILNNLAFVAADHGDLVAAEDYHRRALAVLEELMPGSLDVAEVLHALAEVIARRGDVITAREVHLRSLAIREKLAPGSAFEAESLHSLGALHRRAGERALAADFFQRALASLEVQTSRLGGTEEARSAFGERYADYYRDSLEAWLELGNAAEAFHVLERSRARSLLAMLAERDLLFAADLPAEIVRERRRNDAEYDRAQEALTRLHPARDGEEIERLLGRLRELRVEREEVAAKVRKASPRFASLQYPQPLDLAGVRRVLDPGTVLLSYSVGAEKTVLFVVQAAASKAPGLSVFTIPAGAESLKQKVEVFRHRIARRDAADGQALAESAGDLYRLLVAPAEPLIVPGRRLLLSPDGPLHSLPFAALLRRDGHHLIEWKPLHVVVSATVYAELAKSRRRDAEPPAVTLAAFGDPRYPPLQAEPAAEPELRSILLRGIDLEPLPATRREVEGIVGLYPQGPHGAVKYLGKEATEERAKSLGRSVRYLHFACHGLLDERLPLNSALALTIPESPAEGRDNGLLQAWEIFEQMRIDADLVTLSACETALGKEMGGEGLVGLVRAFQYAGARSVLASLWGVADESTAELMKRFYGYLRAGKTKDEALRAAQIEVMRTPGLSQPFHWGAFEIVGDWR